MKNTTTQKPCEPRSSGSPLPRLVLPLFEWGGDQYPIIAELREGFKLVAHNNAPAITNGDLFSTLDQYDDDAEWLKAVKRQAWEKYQAWTWKLLRPSLDCPTYGKNVLGHAPAATQRGSIAGKEDNHE